MILKGASDLTQLQISDPRVKRPKSDPKGTDMVVSWSREPEFRPLKYRRVPLSTFQGSPPPAWGLHFNENCYFTNHRTICTFRFNLQTR